VQHRLLAVAAFKTATNGSGYTHTHARAGTASDGNRCRVEAAAAKTRRQPRTLERSDRKGATAAGRAASRVRARAVCGPVAACTTRAGEQAESWVEMLCPGCCSVLLRRPHPKKKRYTATTPFTPIPPPQIKQTNKTNERATPPTMRRHLLAGPWQVG
jgi:hypothetical protein